jgi:hypothetical protein
MPMRPKAWLSCCRLGGKCGEEGEPHRQLEGDAVGCEWGELFDQYL